MMVKLIILYILINWANLIVSIAVVVKIRGKGVMMYVGLVWGRVLCMVITILSSLSNISCNLN